MAGDITDAAKLEVIEHFIEQWRPGRSSDIAGERATYLTLKAIAKDIRARSPAAPGRARGRLQRAVDAAKENMEGGAYRGRDFWKIAEAVISEWATVSQALERFEHEVSE